VQAVEEEREGERGKDAERGGEKRQGGKEGRVRNGRICLIRSPTGANVSRWWCTHHVEKDESGWVSTQCCYVCG